MSTTSPLLWLDGRLVASGGATVALLGHAVQRGSLVFDVCAFGGTARGPALFRARDHVERFLRSAGLVGLDPGFGVDELLAAAVRVVAESKAETGLVRWSAFLRAAEPDLLPKERAVSVAVAAFTLDDPPSDAPIRVAVFDDARKASPDVLSPEVKAAGIYLGPYLARQRAIRAGASDVVLLDRDGDVAEAPTANAFAAIGGALVTPPIGRVLPGVTRRTVLELAREEGIPVREEPISKAAFLAADEAFLTATSLPIAPIGWLNDRALADAPGPITRRLVARLGAIKGGREPAREGWLTWCPPSGTTKRAR